MKVNVLTLLVIFLAGCDGVDDTRVIASVRRQDPRAARFHDAFPKAATTISGPLRGGRRQYITRADLDDGYQFNFSLQIEIASGGESAEYLRLFRHYLRGPDGGEADLSSEAVDALIASGGDLTALKPFGIDLSLSPLDSAAVIRTIRLRHPPADMLHKAFPDSWTQVDKPRFLQDGSFYTVATLPVPHTKDSWQISVRCEIRVAPDGAEAELLSKRELTLYNSAQNGSMNLSDEQFSQILKSSNRLSTVELIWSQRRQP